LKVRFSQRFATYYQFKAYLAVSETKEESLSNLGTKMESMFNKCVDCCILMDNLDMKDEIKAEFVGAGVNGFNRAKAHKKLAVYWTSVMKPWEDIPSGTTDTDDYNLRKLIGKIYDEKIKNSSANNNTKRTKSISRYLLLSQVQSFGPHTAT
jgi:hypothetical protein